MNHCWKYYASTQLALTVFKFQDLLNSRCFLVYQYLSINDQKKKKKEKKRNKQNDLCFKTISWHWEIIGGLNFADVFPT